MAVRCGVRCACCFELVHECGKAGSHVPGARQILQMDVDASEEQTLPNATAQREEEAPQEATGPRAPLPRTAPPAEDDPAPPAASLRRRGSSSGSWRSNWRRMQLEDGLLELEQSPEHYAMGAGEGADDEAPWKRLRKRP